MIGALVPFQQDIDGAIMRIALLTHQWPGVRLGGIGAYTRYASIALTRAGHDVHVLTLKLPADAFQSLPEGVSVNQIAGPVAAAGGEVTYRLALAQAFHDELITIHARHPFDIIEGPEYEALAIALAGKNVPVVTQLHSGSAIARDVGNLPADAEQAMREAVELELMTASDDICAPSRAVIADTRAAYDLGNAFAADAVVIPLPFELPETEFELPAVNAPILYLGRLELLKGSHLFADAASIFLRTTPDARIRIAGPDTMTAPDESGTRSNGRSMADWMRSRIGPELLPRVEFLGELSREKITEQLQQCNFVVVPSLRESYSYVCCEALAAGRPVVVSDGIGATEVVGNAGITFHRGSATAMAQAMQQVWQNHELRERLSRAAWNRARSALSSSRTTAKRAAFYQQIIDRRKRDGTKTIEARLAALPPRIRNLAHAARELATGNEPAAADLLKAHGFEPNFLTPGKRLVERLSTHTTGVQFYLYGAGRHTARLLMEKSRWEQHGHKLIGLIDDHPRFAQQPEAYGLPVMSCAAAVQRLVANDVVVLSTDAFEEQFWNQTESLRTAGVKIYKLYGL